MPEIKKTSRTKKEKVSASAVDNDTIEKTIEPKQEKSVSSKKTEQKDPTAENENTQNDDQTAEFQKKKFYDKIVKQDEKENNTVPFLFFFRRRVKHERDDINLDIVKANRYETTIQDGLTLDQVDERTKDGLSNVTHKKYTKSYKKIFFDNLCTFFNLLCIITAGFLIYIGSWGDLFFLAIMLANVTIAIVQEILAKNKVDKLSLVTAPVAVVVRSGERINIGVHEVVLDDILYLENGKQIACDCSLLKGECEVNESLLTGESVPIQKRVGDTLLAGSYISSGACYARVEKVGSANYIETLTAFAKKNKKVGSQLLATMRLFIKIIGFVIIPTVILLAMVNTNNFTLTDEVQMSEAIRKTAGAVIGMIPAGMFLLTSTTLAVSVLNLGKKNVLVQDLYCIEMLARANTLCLDKTGTITDGTMRVVDVVDKNYIIGRTLNDIIGSLVVATGDNNQTAVALGSKFGLSKVMIPNIILPFSSQRKYSAVQFGSEGTFVLGAPEYIVKSLDAETKHYIHNKMKEGLRVVMLAHSKNPMVGDSLPADRKCIAIISLEDHIRDDAVTTLTWFKENDVNLKIISGDNPVTVAEVAKRVGINNAEQFISLEGLSDMEVVEAATQYTVFGRVTPEQKRLLIKSLKAQGQTVAMTGDGVNDILALKEADCSIAMANGSEAARNVAHLILMDSNFGSMPQVVREGRRVVNNIQKSATLFLMKTFLSIVLSWIVILFRFDKYPIEPKQLMLLEIFVIGIPAFFLAFQASNQRITGSFMSNLLKRAVPAGLTITITYLLAYAFMTVFNITGSVDDITINDPSFRAIAMLVVTFSGWMVLVKLCQPLDMYRTVIALFSFVFCMLALQLLSDFFVITPLTSLSWVIGFMILAVVQLSYALLSMILKGLQNFKVGDSAE